MSRYTREIRWRFLGPPGLAQQFMPQARKVLGLIEDTYAANVAGGVIRREIEPGVKVIARRVGFDPSVTIDVRGLAARQAEGEVQAWAAVTPRDNTFPDGVDATYPEALLMAFDEKARQLLRVPYGILYGVENAALDAAPAPKGLYLNRHPLGVQEGGNIDWRSRRGEVLTWYGPSNRYWWDPLDGNTFPQPFLFHQGEVLLDAAAYAASSGDALVGGGVMGAALWRSAGGTLYLHVIHKSGDVHRLVRYSLTIDAGAATPMAVVIIGHSIEATLTQADSLSPWFFNSTGDRAVHMTDPDTNDYSVPGNATEGVVARLTVDEDGSASFATTTTTILSANINAYMGPALLAIDYDAATDEEVTMQLWMRTEDAGIPTFADHTAGCMFFEVAGVYIPASSDPYGSFNVEPGYFGARLFSRRVVFVDLRVGVALFLHYTVDILRETDFRDFAVWEYELYRRDVVIDRQDVLRLDRPFPSTLGVDTFYFVDDTFTSPGYFSPRTAMTAFWDGNSGVYYQAAARGFLASLTDYSQSLFNTQDDETPTMPFDRGYRTSYLYEDARGWKWNGFCVADAERIAYSFYRPILRLDYVPPFDESPDPVDEVRPTLHYVTENTLPGRFGVAAEQSAFYPGWAFGKPIA